MKSVSGTEICQFFRATKEVKTLNKNEAQKSLVSTVCLCCDSSYYVGICITDSYIIVLAMKCPVALIPGEN